jgi:hypothetical protein
MARFNFNSVRNIASTRDSFAWEKINFEQKSTLIFAALLIVCSLAVGCSSEKPKTDNTSSQPVMAQNTPSTTTPVTPVVATAAETTPKPAPKKAVRKTPVTVKYIDKTSGVSFRYPRKYGLKTGDSANQLVSEASTPMGFTQPGGIAIAAVAIPEGAYPKSDLVAAWFDVSVNKSLTAEQCAEFSDGTTTPSPAPVADAATNATPAPAVLAPTPASKLMLGDIELKSLETLASVGAGKEASKYYHVFQNGACYEFTLKVATTGESDEGGKPVDRGEVFKRLEKILATVKIDTVKIDAVSTPEVTATAPAAPVTPAQ